MCCHEFDLSNTTNWQHIGGGPSDRNFCRNFCLARPGILNFHLWCRFFSSFGKITTFQQQKQLVVFKQHDPQSVTDLNGVAGDPLITP